MNNPVTGSFITDILCGLALIAATVSFASKVLDLDLPDIVVLVVFLLLGAGSVTGFILILYGVIAPVTNDQFQERVNLCLRAFETYTRAQCEFLVSNRGGK